MDNSPNSVDPAAEGDLGGVLTSILKKALQKVDGSLPAVVISYDRSKNMATVRPLIAVLTTGGKVVQRAQIASVPVLALGGAGFLINFPLKPGDKGWIKANDRDISLYMQSSREAQPNTNRIHSFEDGQFIPDAMGQGVYATEDANKMVIQSYDGQTKITLAPGEIRAKAALIKMDGNVQHTGIFTNTGGVIIDGIPFGGHGHTGVVTGTGTSAGPKKL